MKKDQSKNDIYLNIIDKFHIVIWDFPITLESKQRLYEKCVELVYEGLNIEQELRRG